MKLFKALTLAGVLSLGTLTGASLANADEAHWTKGTVKKIDTTQSKITVQHEAIKNLDMPSMTMIFFAPDASILEGLKAGDKKQFEFGDMNGRMVVKQIK